MQSVVDDISRRKEAHDPTLPDVQSWGIGENVVHIGVINLTPDQEAALHSRYGDRVEGEDEGPIDH